jgi:NlpC/P60 family putative phage cell wall peptidase
MTVARAAVVAAGRTWLGTPFHHQGRMKGVGVDCVGLVIGVAQALELSDFDLTGYGHRPDSREMERLCRAMMRRVAFARARPGDVLLFNVDGQPQHLAFKTDAGMLHAYAPQRRVVEHRIDDSWAARAVAAFVLPGVK